MKGARRRGTVRPERNLRRILIASVLYAALSTHHAYAQPSSSMARPSTAFDRGSAMPASRFNNGGIVRAQKRSGKSAGEQDKPAMQPVQQMDQVPPARPPRHTVMTADERRLLRQHIEEAVRDLYKR
ncbi:hypothetical protein BUMB_02879c [Candidatus Paraburkholderia calva]|nr:hypothetical protein BUMB_02879c [Candidatus Paraburkholderia calva]